MLNARTLQALTRERISTILASTKRIVTVECTPKVVDSVVQEHDHIRKKAVQELIPQFETHPNKEALQADLNKIARSIYSASSRKNMIYSTGNMDYFEICGIIPKYSSNCMTYWTKDIEKCVCGTCSRFYDKVRKFNSDRYDVLSTPNNVIKKGPSHGARRGNTERQRIDHAVHLSSKKAKKKYDSIVDRFLNSLRYRQSQFDIGWTEEHCTRLDAYRYGGKANQTWKHLGFCGQQLRSERPHESARRLPRSQKG